MTTHVSILIPSRGQRTLAALATDAIAAFTQDVSHDVRLLDHAGARVGWPTDGSACVGESLTQLAIGVIYGWPQLNCPPPTHIFVMHDDALPLRPGWLAYLLAQPGPVVGVKRSEATGLAHGSGVLFSWAAFRAADLRPARPRRDAGEAAAPWCAPSVAWRPSVLERQGHTPHGEWWRRYPCDVSLDEQGVGFYAHLGGATLGIGPEIQEGVGLDMQARDVRVAAWITAARRGLGL